MRWIQNCTDTAVTVANAMATLARGGIPADRLVKGAVRVPPGSKFTEAQLRRMNLCGIYEKGE